MTLWYLYKTMHGMRDASDDDDDDYRNDDGSGG
jgi:hypothetical protein